MSEVLEVWLYGTRVAEIERGANQRLALRFTDDARRRFGPTSAILSVSLAIRREPYSNALTRNFLDGLLPEGDARGRIARELELHDEDTFGLVRELGRDSAGALMIQPDGGPRPLSLARREARAIDENEVARRLVALPTSPLGVDHYVRLSLAGEQRKLVLVRREDGGWALPADGIPSTHILKPQHQNSDWSHTVENEAYAMQLAKVVGLNVASVAVVDIGGQRVLVVERFDRTTENGQIERVHQEDFCQAFGLRPRDKYQSSGGPSLRKVADALSRYSGNRDVAELLRLTTFNVAVGNADAHGKNVALLHRPDGSLELAPAYDVMSTTFYPDLDQTLGMYVDGVRNITKVTPDRLVNEAVQWGMDRDEASHVVTETLTRATEAYHDSLLSFEEAVPFAKAVGRRAEQMLETTLRDSRAALPGADEIVLGPTERLETHPVHDAAEWTRVSYEPDVEELEANRDVEGPTH
ncbi:MAG: HipA domain-containing protein [Acidimicrobiales bacterium]